MCRRVGCGRSRSHRSCENHAAASLSTEACSAGGERADWDEHYLEVWSGGPPPGYLGQLDSEFQRQLADRWADVGLEDCYFYHCARLRDGSFIDGPWDLLDNELEHYSRDEVAGHKVLEFGPANGWLTHWMADQGADVVVLDVGWDLLPTSIPLRAFDMETMRGAGILLCQRAWTAWCRAPPRLGSHRSRSLCTDLRLAPGPGKV